MNPYQWQFPDRTQTMFLSTINSKSPPPPTRPSTFQLTDIPGTQPAQQIPQYVYRSNFAHSDYIQPRPQRYRQVMNKSIQSYQLSVEGIDKAYPIASSFKTNRVVDPLAPKYKLPYVNPVYPQQNRSFLRNTLDISDIVTKKPNPRASIPKQPIEGSSPSKLFKTLQAPSRLPTPPFKSTRSTHPLQPQYAWRDQTRNQVNNFYGQISHSQPKKPYQRSIVSSSLDVKDIEGAYVNSSNQKRYFLDKRKQFRDYMKIGDIGGTSQGSLKKGISTGRVVNPLMPVYKYPDC